MSFSNQTFRWMTVLGALTCLFIGNETTAQEQSSRDRVSPVDGPTVLQVTGKTFDGDCPAPPPECGGGVATAPPCDDYTPSLGQFKILVSPRFRKNMTGCPGYDEPSGILTSPLLFDDCTVIGRSVPHLDASAPDLTGTDVGAAPSTLISDMHMLIRPFEALPGTREVHTELRALFLTDGAGSNVRAGFHASGKPFSPGEVESNSGPSGDPKLDFPARSFFDMYVEADIPGCGGFPGGTVFNIDPLLVVNENLANFPPQVVYIHGGTSAVPVFFRTPSAKWVADELFGWLVLAGHGVDVEVSVFEDALAAAPLMPVPEQCDLDSANLGCWSGCLTCDETDAGCATPVTQPGVIMEETNFLPFDLALVQSGDKINRFQEAVQAILAKQDPPPQIVKIANVQDAIAAIQGKKGSRVVIFGHGAPGYFKVGEDNLSNADIQDKFIAALKGQFKTLHLYGCEVSQGAIGQAFLKKLAAALQRPVHAWDGKVYAFGHDPVIPVELQNRFFREADTDKKEIPAVTEWGIAVMVLLVLAAGTVVIRRLRTAPA